MLDAKEAAPISQTIPEAEKNKAEEKSISETPGAIAATVSNPEEQPSSVLTAATEEKTEENKKGTSNDAKSEEEKSETSPIFQTSPVQIPDISTLDPSSANKTTPAPFPGKAPSPLPAPPLTRAADSRITLTTTSNPDTQISDSSERIIYATTLSHTDATKPIDGGKLVITVENGKFNTIPAVMDHQDILKTATLSSDGKTITLEFKDGMVSGNYNSFTYSAYAAVGIPAGANVTVKSVFTGNFKGETAAFENESEKSVTADFVGIKPVVPGSTSWKPYALASKVLHPGVRVEMSQGIQNPNNVPEGFSNLQFKIEFSDSTKVDWFKNNYLGKYFLQLRGGGQKSVALSADQIKKIDDKTYILTIGEINPSEVSHVYLYPHITPPADAAAGDAFDVKQTILENDTEINSHSTHFTVEGKQTELSFDAIRGGNAQLKPGQDFSTAYKVEGVTTDPVNDHVTEITVPSEVVTKKVLNGILSGTTKNVKSVEYLSASSWKEVAKNADGDFDLPDVPIEKLRINYVSVNGQVRNYQAFRVFWKLKDDAADGTAIKLKHQVSYTDANGVKQMPDVSAQDLSYTVKADAVSAATKAGVYQYNRSSREFDQGTVLSGDSFTMNYRLAAMAGELEQPYVFVKVPKGIEVQNLYNTIQYPYGNRISYVYAPSNGRTVTPISQANNVGSFEAADGSTVYYFKANDTKLVKEDYIQQLFIENKYIAKNIESGIYEVEVGMGSLKENYEDVSLASGYSKSSLSAELQFKLGSAATTYYSKKTKMTVGKVDKVTTGVSVKGSEDSAWLDASKTGKVVPGKKVSYRVSIKNEGTENYSDVQLVNLLPYVGDTLVSSSAPRNSQFQINPDSSGVSVKLNGKATSDVVLEYSLSNNPVRFSSPNGDPIGADAWVGAVSDYSKVRAIRVAAPSMTLKPGDEITLEYSGVVVLDAQRPQNDTDSYKANNSVAYRFVTADGEVRAGEPSVSTVATTKAVNDGLISGSSYIDLNKNGSKDVGEPGLNQLSLELFKKNSSGQFVSTGVTSESSSNSAGDNGIFGFTDLDYGTYKVKVKLPNTKGAAFITTGADKLEKIDDTTAWLVLNGSSEFILNDSTSTSHQMKDLRVPIFVNTPLTGSINFKNKAGAVVGSDYGKGFTVDLYKGTTKVATTTSGAAGVYTFEGLTIDSKETYTLKFTFPSGKQYDYTADNSNGELTIELEPGIGTADRTDLYITDTNLPTAKIAVAGGFGTDKDVNPNNISLTASDAMTAFTTAWEISRNGNVEYAGTSQDGTTSLRSQLEYLIGDKKAGDYSLKMTVSDAAGNQAVATEQFSLKFGTVSFMVDATEYAKTENVFLYIDTLTKPKNPTKAGYSFDTWLTADNKPWNFSTGTISEENVVLTASFKALEQTLSFDVNGGDASSKPADMKVKTDASVDITKISVPTRTGYNFKHWYVKGDTAKTAVGASMTMPAKAVTLVAEWEVNTYSIKYDANGGSAAVPMADLTATYGVDIALSANTYTRDGYLFKGWALKADATTAAYQDKASVKNLSSAKDGQVTLYAVWAKDFTAIEAKDSTIYVGDSWTAADNFVSAADSDGNKVEFKDVTVAGIVDTTQTGDYVITYSYGGQSARATVKVLANQSTIDAKDSTIYTGWEWTAEDNFVSATDKTGAVVDFKDVTVTGTVDTEKVGDYTVTYRYGGKEVTVTVHVLENKISVKGKKSEIFVGDTWTAADNFVSATDETGAAVDFADVQVKGTVDTSKAGKYYVSYTHTRNHVVRISGITVTVLENQTSIEAKDSTIYVGDTWSAEDNFVKATDKKGTNVDFKEVTVSGTVDTTQVGDYDITYSYGGKDNKVTVHVLADQTSVEVKDIELYEGENWNAKDNFVSATDKTGAALKFDQVTVTDAEKVDTTKVGVYEVIYTNGSLSKTAKVTVKPDQREVQVQHTTLTVGDDWHPKNNFVSAKDHDGNDLAFEDLETEGSVDTSKAGIYKVTYNYSKKPIKKQRETKDAPEKGTAVAEITVVEKANDGDKTPPPSDDNGPKDDNKPNDVSGLNGNNKPDNLNKPNDSGTNQSGQNYTGNNSKPAAARTSTKSSTLPKAGENDKLIVPALGGALLLAAGLIATVLRRKKR